MNNYYKTNAIYVELEKRGSVPFVWTSGNAWILLYANSAASVRVVAFVTGKSTTKSGEDQRLRLEAARATAVAMATAAGVPFAAIEFDDEAESIDSVTLNGIAVSLDELKAWFAKAGLPVQGPTTSKTINDASSSAYHNWQRANLGAIKVSDIDLVRLAPKTKAATEIFELKRSFIALEKWKPYTVDYQNFNVLADLATRVGVRLTIAYNVRVTKPVFVDDAARISLFAYSRDAGARSLGEISFDEFLQGKYPA